MGNFIDKFYSKTKTVAVGDSNPGNARLLSCMKYTKPERLCLGYFDGSIDRQNLTTKAVTLHEAAHKRGITGIRSNDQLLLSTGRDGYLKAWNDFNCINSILANEGGSSCLDVDFERNLAVTGGRDVYCRIFDVSRMEAVTSFTENMNVATDVQFSIYDPRLIIQSAEDLCVRLWDMRSQSDKPTATLSGFSYFPTCIVQDNHSPFMFYCGTKGFESFGGEIWQWDVRNSDKPIIQFSGHEFDVIGGLPLYNDQLSSQSLISISKDGQVFQFESNGHISHQVRFVDTIITCCSDDSTGKRLIIGDMNGNISACCLIDDNLAIKPLSSSSSQV